MRKGYFPIVVESFVSEETCHRGQVHIRPTSGQNYSADMFIECSRHLVNTNYFPIGTKFRIWVKPKQKESSRIHLYSYHGDDFEVLHNDSWIKAPAHGPFPKIKP